MMKVFEVGKPYIAGRVNWPEGAEYNYHAGAHELRLFINSPSPKEIAAVSNWTSEFALAVEPPVILFLYRFVYGIDWRDAPYSWHLVPADQRTLPDPEGPETGAPLHVILVDAGSGLVRALRAVTFSPEFTRTLHGAIRVQAESPWPGQAAYDAAVADLRLSYLNFADLRRRAVAHTRGRELKGPMTKTHDAYIDAEVFPILEGERMCPRCSCCTVGVGPYEPPWEVSSWEDRFIPSASSLVPEPSADPSAPPEAWYCRGGCDENGSHAEGRREPPPSLIGRVKKAGEKP